MIPKEWRQAKLGELCSPKQWPTIGAKEMTASGVRVFGANGFIGYFPTANHAEDTLVITCRGATCGEVTIVPGPSYITGNAMCLDDVNPTLAIQYFLAEALRFAGTKPLISGSAQPQIIRADVLRFEVPLPPLSEQGRIAEVLSTWDRAIETVEALIVNARTQKQALMQTLLTGKKRLPGFSGEWHWVTFSDVFERVREKNEIGNTNVLTISAQHGLISQVEYFNKSVASDDVRGYTLLRRGDFAYNKSYSDGYPMGAFKPLERYDSGIVSSLYICFRLASPDHDHDFFRHYFEAGLFNQEVSAIAQEGARNHGLLNVSVVDFFDTSLHAPSREEQAAIAHVINEAESIERGLEAQLESLRQEKSALMQQLLSGKRRVKVIEEDPA